LKTPGLDIIGNLSKIAGCHGGEYEVLPLSSGRGSKYLSNVSKLLPYYTAQEPRRQPSVVGNI
jgi:hypothetical protein